MRLLSAPASPYGRKVKITLLMKGLKDQVRIETVSTLPVSNPELQADNPLAKIPVLITDGGESLYDSKVICEYLDAQVASPVLFPGDGPERWRTLTLGALGDGILDAALLLVYEKRFRPEDKWVDDWMVRQQNKIDAALAHVEKSPPAWQGTPDYGHITLASALGYLDFRHEGKWRAEHPKLVAWLDDFARHVPAFDATRPS
ncbi:MAG: glutathione S-transferase family protein [Hyphomicrobiaceae bacterium]